MKTIRRFFPPAISGTLPLVTALSVLLSSPPVAAAMNPHKSIMPCASADIHLLHTSALTEQQARGEGAPDTPALGIVDMAPSSATLGQRRKALLALGPVLGSMDSRKVKTQLSCTKNGMVVTATITRSAASHGAATKGVLWRPQVSVVFLPRIKDMHFTTIWKMHLSNGKPVHKATTPGHKTEHYPIRFKKTVQMY